MIKDPRSTAAFIVGTGIAGYETIHDARLQVYGFCLMLMIPTLASIGERILTGNGNGNSKNGGRGSD